ncbi:MAG: hypothetical protein ACXV3F_16410, partial [Frankiaceae bacterium]
ISELPHATATIVPFQLGRPFLRIEPTSARAGQAAGTGRVPRRGAAAAPEAVAAPAAPVASAAAAAEQQAPAAEQRAPATPASAQSAPQVAVGPAEADNAPPALRPGRKARVQGKLRSVTVRPVEGVPVLECALIQGESVVVLRFMGRRRVIGIRPGVTIKARGTVRCDIEDRLVIDNPSYALLDTGPADEDE